MRVGIAFIHYRKRILLSFQSLQYMPFVGQRHATSLPHHLVPQPTKMSSQDESARLFQKMVVFKYVADDKSKQSKEILINRDTIAQYNVRGVIMLARPRAS